MPRPDPLQLLKQHIAAHPGDFFDPHGAQLHVASAPGRLDILGGLGVQVGGTVAQMALPVRAAVAVQLNHEPRLLLRSDHAFAEISLPPPPYSPPSPPDDNPWTAPIVALWQAAGHLTQGYAGARIMIKSSIPKRAEQGSSAALLSALLLAIALPLRPPLVEPAQLANIIQDAQSRINRGGPGARIDAMTCLLAAPPNPSRQHSVIRYSSQPCELIGHVPLPPHLHILALDTGRRNTALEATLQELQVAGAMGLTIIETIYRDLGQPHTPLHGYLANTSPLLYRQYFRALLPKRLRGSDFLRTYGISVPTFPGNATLDPAAIYRVRTAVDHLIAENEHAEQFLQALEELSETTPSGRPVITDPEERQRTLQRAGRLALASHHSYRLRLELSCPEADWIVDKLMQAGPDKGIYGARITGAGGGGTVMALVDDSSAAGDAVLQTIQDYPNATGRTLSVLEAGTPGSSGALLSDLA